MPSPTIGGAIKSGVNGRILLRSAIGTTQFRLKQGMFCGKYEKIQPPTRKIQ
jgi:hypothetical protein